MDFLMRDHTRLVYSTEQGSLKLTKPQKVEKFDEGIAKISFETKGRRGNGVTTIPGLYTAENDLKKLAKNLKRNCSSGGSIKNNIIEIQGDHKEKVLNYLKRLGYSVR